MAGQENVDVPGVESKGGKVADLGTQLMDFILKAQENMNPATPGLKTPSAFEAMASDWVSHCDNLSNKLDSLGAGIKKSGGNHATTDVGNRKSLENLGLR